MPSAGGRIAFMFWFAAAAANADIFSPGPLNKAHANLEGLSNCTRCHVAGGQLSPRRCLDCHAELKERVAKSRGYHGLLPPADRDACNTCHREHQGRDFALVDWGKGGKAAFDHRSTGFALLGKHAGLKCDQCHDDRLIADPAIRALKAKSPRRETYLGVGIQCSSCHFDEHRGQLGTGCKDCHDERAWKPARSFDHASTDFPLEGKHAQVKCASCHARERDVRIASGAFPAPFSDTFSRFKPVGHASCTDCHKDPHDNRFGQDCQSCHTLDGWLALKGAAGQRAFHEKTRYPLRGAHTQVPCRSCHGPSRGEKKAVFKGMAFDQCTACHVDAHLSQFGRMSDATAACDRCHTVQGFRPARYEAQDHKSWPLLGAHEAVACARCHRPDARLESRAAPVRAFIEQRGRKDAISLVQFRPSGEVSRCEACHADPHGGQFRERIAQGGCEGCHEVGSWNRIRFDHDRETAFPLTGGHANRACAACHAADERGAVRYRQVSRTCASCHADVHAGQFAGRRGEPADCTRCHSTAAWARTSFEHRPPFTSFELQGRHESVSCAGCHREIDVGGGVRVTRYRGLPVTCEGCHVDVHRGTFQGFTP
jgi:hypothetical protein